MKEITGNIFDIKDADAICVTTNGIVKANGELVMGAGIALQFKNRYNGLAYRLGKKVKKEGNVVHTDWVSYDSRTIVSFPTKEHYKDKSDIGLIVQSAHQLVKLADGRGWKKIVLPQPGCGLGGLDWKTVKAAISPILDDRFYIITPANGKGVGVSNNDSKSDIEEFAREYRFLSNFWPCKVSAWGLVFDNVEAAYQAAKCANIEERAKFVSLSAAEAKKLGRTIKIREDWDDKKITVMRFFLKQKFRPGTKLASDLLVTGDKKLVEGNYWRDTFWGVCGGIGQNNLGKLLMEIREELRKA